MNGRVGRMETSDTQSKFEEETGLTRAGWRHFQQLLDPRGAYGPSAMRIHAVGELYKREGDTMEFWWEGPESITRVILNGKTYPNPAPEVIRMLVQ